MEYWGIYFFGDVSFLVTVKEFYALRDGRAVVRYIPTIGEYEIAYL